MNVRVKLTRPDGTIVEVEGDADEVARVLREHDRQTFAPPAPIAIPVIFPPTELHPPAIGPIWVSPIHIQPHSPPGWPITTCSITSRKHDAARLVN